MFDYGSQAYCEQERWSIEGVPELPLTPGTWRIVVGEGGATAPGSGAATSLQVAHQPAPPPHNFNFNLVLPQVSTNSPTTHQVLV